MIGISEEKWIKAYLYFYDEYIDEENKKEPIANFIKKYYKYTVLGGEDEKYKNCFKDFWFTDFIIFYIIYINYLLLKIR